MRDLEFCWVEGRKRLETRIRESRWRSWSRRWEILEDPSPRWRGSPPFLAPQTVVRDVTPRDAIVDSYVSRAREARNKTGELVRSMDESKKYCWGLPGEIRLLVLCALAVCVFKMLHGLGCRECGARCVWVTDVCLMQSRARKCPFFAPLFHMGMLSIYPNFVLSVSQTYRLKMNVKDENLPHVCIVCTKTFIELHPTSENARVTQNILLQASLTSHPHY